MDGPNLLDADAEELELSLICELLITTPDVLVGEVPPQYQGLPAAPTPTPSPQLPTVPELEDLWHALWNQSQYVTSIFSSPSF
jgi:hypothetical protein